MSYVYLQLSILGYQGCGKSSFCNRFTVDRYSEEDHITTESHWRNHVMENINYNISMNEVRNDAGAYYVQISQGFVLLYSIDSKESFEQLKSFWGLIESQKANMTSQVKPKIVVVGTKSDIPKEFRKVSQSDGELFAKEHGALFLEASAKTGENVTFAFETLMREIISDPNFKPNSYPYYYNKKKCTIL